MPTTLGHKLVTLDNTGAEDETREYQAIRGVPQRRRTVAQVLRRPGVDDVTIRELGTRASAFVLVSLEYKQSLAAAKTAVDAYQAEIASGMQYGIRVYQQGVDQGKFAVLGVRQLGQAIPIGAAVNSLIADPACQLTMEWTLIEQDLIPPAP